MKNLVIVPGLLLILAGCSVNNPGNGCAMDTDCSEAQACEAGTCVSLCDPECEGREMCDSESRTCVGSCETGADCGPNERCNAGRCSSTVECTDRSQCPDGQNCLGGECTDLECRSNGECLDDFSCVEGACIPEEGCVVGTSRCNSNTVIECQAGGITAETPCPDGSLCLEGNSQADCREIVCEADTATCVDADTMTVCNSTGTVTTDQDCGVGEVCAQGRCGPIPCEPFEVGCADESTAYACDGDGAVELIACREDQFCEDALCRDRSCAPGESGCVGDTVVTCDDTGTSVSRVYCAALSECVVEEGGCACVEAACQPRVCFPGSRRCVGNAAQACSPDGTTWMAREECVDGTSCVAGSCLPDECESGEERCSGEISVRCNDGVWAQRDCAESGKICVGGRCEAPLCEPGSPLCADGDVATRCNFRGDGVEAGTDCGDIGLSCVDGECLDTCEPGARRCVQGGVEICGEDGLMRHTVECGPAEGCRDGVCVPRVCEPGDLGCDGARVAQCDETGFGYLPGGENCAERGLRCRAAECVEAANQCPVTVARAGSAAAQVPLREGYVVVPDRDALQLDGIASTDDSRVARVRWTRIDGPDDVRIEEAGDPRQAVVRGLSPYDEYVFEAVAIDDEGTEACEPAQIRVFTVGAERLVFHLLWENVADPDPLDGQGSDVDIHLLKARDGTWFDNATDCHWGAPAPEWGPESPRQILDDTNGRGPEIIVLDNPSPCNWYATAIHYFDPRGFGGATADLHIFRQGLLEHAVYDHVLRTRGAWWEAALVHWDSGEVFAVDEDFPDPRNQERPQFSSAALDSRLCGIPEDVDDD